MEIANSIPAKFGEFLVAPLVKQFWFLIHHKSNLENLKEQSRTLCAERAKVQLKIDRARWNGEVISHVVKLWVQEVDETIEGLSRFLEEASRIVENGWSPNLMSCYPMSRKAKKMTQAIVKFL